MNARVAKTINKISKKLNRDARPLKRVYYALKNDAQREEFHKYWKERLA